MSGAGAAARRPTAPRGAVRRSSRGRAEADATAGERALQRRLGYLFVDVRLLRAALTHATFAFEQPSAGPHYERLEFLGDAVVGLLAAALLVRALGDASEGELTARRARLVRREALATLAGQLELAPLIRLGAGQRATAGVTERMLADVLEAVVGAVFLDGGMAAAEATFAPLLAASIAAPGAPDDAKTRLQEACHRRGIRPPEYAVVGTDGPDHARRFCCRVQVAGGLCAEASARTKRAAEQLCAGAVLGRLVPADAPRGPG